MADLDRREDVDRHDSPAEAVRRHLNPLPAWIEEGAVAAISVSKVVYPRRAVLAAAYDLSSRCAVLVDEDGEDRWAIFVVGRPRADARNVLDDLIRRLADHALRDQLEEQFGAVRTLIVAQAFAEGNLLGTDEE